MSSLLDETTFDETEGTLFIEYYNTIRGFVRERMVQKNLDSYLPKKPAKVIDIGGGDGRDALWLARLGYDVTLAEPSLHMLSKARSKIDQEPKSVQKHITLLEGTDESALQKYGEGSFDLVLSHGVLMYEMERPAEHVKKLFELAKRGGVVSLLTKGLGGAKAELISEERLDELKRLYETGIYRNHLNKLATAYDDTALTEFITQAGGEVQGWFGVRVVTDHMYQAVTEFSESQLQDILNVEAWASRKESVRGLGQLLHFIATKK